MSEPLDKFFCDTCKAQVRMLKPLQVATCRHHNIAITLRRDGSRTIRFKNGLKQSMTITADDLRLR